MAKTDKRRTRDKQAEDRERTALLAAILDRLPDVPLRALRFVWGFLAAWH